MELKKIMILHISCTLTILFALLSTVECIRVDWNTNEGPIIPPTSTPEPVPQPPFRDPSPVSEDQSNDVPNPNEYRFVMPPPSRPRPNDLYDNDYKYNKWQAYKQQQLQEQQQRQMYGKILSDSAFEATQNIVPSLSVKYYPNYGFRYFAVVPEKQYFLKTNDLSNSGKYDKYDKWNGKFNKKTKSYKAYDYVKVKPTTPTKSYSNVPKQQYQQQQQTQQKHQPIQQSSKLQTSPQQFEKQPYEQPANSNFNNNVANTKS